MILLDPAATATPSIAVSLRASSLKMCPIIDEMWFQCLKTPLYGNEKCILPWIWMNPLVSSCTLNSFFSSHINISSPQTANTYSPSFSLSRVSERQIYKMRFNCLLEQEARNSLHRLLRCWPEVYIYMYIYRRTVYTNLPFFNSRTVSEYPPLSFCDEKSSPKPPCFPFIFPFHIFLIPRIPPSPLLSQSPA